MWSGQLKICSLCGTMRSFRFLAFFTTEGEKEGGREGGREKERERGGWKGEKRQKISGNLTKEGKKLCLNWSPQIFTPEEEFLSSLFSLKPLFYSLCNITRWGESHMLWEYQENHTASTSHKPLAQHVDKTEKAVSSSKPSHIRYDTAHSRMNMYCHIPTLSGVFNITRKWTKEI